MKAFDQSKPVTIHNEWPLSKYPIPKGTLVWFYENGQLLSGKVTWYHPARKRDASCIISPGFSFYKVKVAGVDSHFHAASRFTQRKSKLGFEALRKTIIADMQKRRKESAELFAAEQGRFDSNINFWKGFKP